MPHLVGNSSECTRCRKPVGSCWQMRCLARSAYRFRPSAAVRRPRADSAAGDVVLPDEPTRGVAAFVLVAEVSPARILVAAFAGDFASGPARIRDNPRPNKIIAARSNFLRRPKTDNRHESIIACWPVISRRLDLCADTTGILQPPAGDAARRQGKPEVTCFPEALPSPHRRVGTTR